MSARPKVVALTPVWEAQDFVGKTLESLAAQTWPNLEILIAVDQSQDGSAALCQAFAKARANVRVHEHQQRQGWVGNVNWLLQAAQGDYFFFAFHDDVLAPAYVESLVRALEANPDAILAFSDMETRDPDGRVEVSVYDTLDGVSSAVARGRKVLWRIGAWWTPNRGLFRSQAAGLIGGLKRHAAGEFSADWPWLLHMTLLGTFVRVPGVLCFKNYTAKSLSRGWRFSLHQWLAVSAACLREINASPLSWRDRFALILTVWSVRRRWLTGALRGRVLRR